MSAIGEIQQEEQNNDRKQIDDMLFRFRIALKYNHKSILDLFVYGDIPIASFVDPRTGNTALHYVSLYPDKTNLILFLIEKGAEIDAQNARGETPLHYALIHALDYLYDNLVDIPTAKKVLSSSEFLVKNGASLNIFSSEGLSPLQEALLSGFLEAAEIFFTCYIDRAIYPNEEFYRAVRCFTFLVFLFQEGSHYTIAESRYSTLLHFAAINKQELSFLFYLNEKQNDFDVNAFSPSNETLLHITTRWGTPLMMRALLERGANIEAGDQRMRTPLHYGVFSGDIDKVRFLLDCNANVDSETEEFLTPLHYAISMEMYEIVELLVDKGADVNAISHSRTPLLIACGGLYAEDPPGTPLHELNHVFMQKDYFQFMPTGPSAKGYCKRHIYNSNIVQYLICNGANIEARTRNGLSPLDFACKKGNLEIVEILLDHGAQISRNRFTTLHCAIAGAHPEIIRLILKQGANVNYGWRNFGTPLEFMFGIRGDFSELLDILLKFEPDVNLTFGSVTPLHLACLGSGRENIIRRLLKYNADVNAFDKEGWVPLSYTIFTWYHVNGLFHYGEILVPYISRMIADNKYVSEQNLKILRTDPEIQIMYQECVKEIERLKNSRVHPRVNLTFFDLLTRDLDDLGGILRNRNVLWSLQGSGYRDMFPIYASDLEERIREAKIKRRLVIIASDFLKLYVPFDICLIIFKNCSIRDLLRFIISWEH